jgi:hypothetical protein
MASAAAAKKCPRLQRFAFFLFPPQSTGVSSHREDGKQTADDRACRSIRVLLLSAPQHQLEERMMANGTIGLEEAVRRTLVEREDIPAAELVRLLRQRYGLTLDVRFLPIIKAWLRHRAQAEAQRAAARGAEPKPATGAGDANASSCTEQVP